MVCWSVRLNVAGVGTPPTVALTTSNPGLTGVAVIDARPLLSVLATPLSLKLNPEPLNVTVTFRTGLPLLSVTCTTRGFAKAVFSTPLCRSPE